VPAGDKSPEVPLTRQTRPSSVDRNNLQLFEKQRKQNEDKLTLLVAWNLLTRNSACMHLSQAFKNYFISPEFG